ncbi:MAG: NUDIX hydrolase [gamma proteobacterium symbiont of Bathyaustriella thionipta]|nr:NUDIX hydrolase [gamma proteobacterium symbiont of Bathyaustriella thionipta]
MPAGKEQRDRPAYYYTQSSVIPYRINKGQLQILIVRSSKKKHWIIPKGIAEPGYSLQDSAKKEAWEEAGVEGKVSQTALGSYLYIKWGAQCTVSVYPMRVSRELAEKDWQESHRGRRWVSVKEAGDCLRQEQLQPLLKQLQKQLQ